MALFLSSHPHQKTLNPIAGDERLEFDWMAQGIVFLLFLSLGGAAIQLLRKNHASMVKFFSLYAVLIGLLIVDGVALQWGRNGPKICPLHRAMMMGHGIQHGMSRGEEHKLYRFTIDGEVRSAGGVRRL